MTSDMIITTNTDTNPVINPALLAGQCTPSTIAMYERDTRAYLAWARGKNLAPNVAETLARWRTDLAQYTTMSPRTINRMLSAVKSTVKEAANQGYTTYENAEQFRHVDGVKIAAMKERQRPGNRTRISAEDMRRLVAAPDRTTTTGRRDAALLATFAGTGARVAEVAGLTIGQIIKQGRNCYQVSIMGKNDATPRLVALTAEAYKTIMAWIDTRPIASQYVFTSAAGRGNRFTAEPISEVSAWRIVQTYAAQVGLSHVKPHDFRRFVGTRLTEKLGVAVAQKQLGHKNARTTLDNYVLSDVPEGATEGLY